jgi:ketosteroid isomerase-like protein
MSRDNVEIVRNALDALNRGDAASLFDSVLDPEIEFVTSGSEVGQAGYFGFEGVRELQSLLEEAFSEIRIEADELRPSGDAVVVLGHLVVKGRASGAEGRSARAWVFTLRDGKITRQQTFQDQGAALASVGLGE